MREFLIAVTRNPLSLTGTAITTASALVFVGLFAVDLTSHYDNPYMGIVAYMILPAIFVVGLILIPIGLTLLVLGANYEKRRRDIQRLRATLTSFR